MSVVPVHHTLPSQPLQERSDPSNDLREIHLAAFTTASSELLQSRSLQKRTDTKFVLGSDSLLAILSALPGAYSIAEARGRRITQYETLYFDTADLRCFHDHRRGRTPRHKIRIRHYPDRELSFLEVKRGGQGTQKFRQRRAFGDARWTAADGEFVREVAGLRGVAPQLWTNFRRITLVGRDCPERVTIDLDLQFQRNTSRHGLAACAVFEVKQRRLNLRSPVFRALRSVGARPASLSKYCTATLLSHPGIRGNRLLPTLRHAQRQSQRPPAFAQQVPGET